MMNNLFSIFDPTTSSLFSSNWLSLFLILLLAPKKFWLIESRSILIFSKLMNYLSGEFNNNTQVKNKKIIFSLVSIFIFIMLNNISGLSPYFFTATSHLSVTLAVAFPLWLLITIFGWMNLMNYMFAHLVPNGAPIGLSFFMVIVETISFLIRPITLAVRLAANMIAGHLLICLLSSTCENFQEIFFLSSGPLTILLSLEIAVAFIQSYVFSILFSLYLSEIN